MMTKFNKVIIALVLVVVAVGINAEPTQGAVVYDCSAQSSIPILECEALVALYNSTGGYTWTTKTNWFNADPCTWHGITCDAGAVTRIELSTNQLSGSIPAELGNLSNLSNLYLDHNELSGSIPAELGKLSNLLTIYLHNNQLGGSIPAELGKLSNLLTIYLHNNQLSGNIPAELGDLGKLRTLSFASNNLSGSIPAELGNLSQLRLLNLSYNQLSGSIPAELGNLSNLLGLHLNNNDLSGSIPAELGNLSNLWVLYLDHNDLSGSLPLNLTNLTGLGIFTFNNTDLCEPGDAAFQNWMERIINVVSTGIICNTLSGTNVTVTPTDSATGSTPVTITFSNVTMEGDTTLTTSSAGPAVQPGFSLGSPPTYYDISTTADFSGTIEICINYTGVSFTNEDSLVLSHYDGSDWVPLTTSLDTVNKVICAVVTSLSPFAIFEPEPSTPTPTPTDTPTPTPTNTPTPTSTPTNTPTPTSQEIIQDTQDTVQSLVDTDILNKGQGKSLVAKLDAVLKTLDKGKVTSAIQQLEAFINQVNALVEAGIITPAEAQPLLDATNDILNMLN